MSEEVETPKPKGKKAGKKKPTALQIALRREKISELMLAGYDENGVRRIADYLNKINIECSKSTVAGDIKFLLAESAKNTGVNVEQKREMAFKQLESLRQAYWFEAQRGNLKSGKFCRDLINDQIDLYGGKAAQKVEIQGKDGGPIKVSHTVDLSNLTTEELLMMEALVSKTAVKQIEAEKPKNE